MKSRFWPPVIFLIAAAIPLWQPLLRGETIGPWEQIAPMMTLGPWQPPPPGWDVLQADAALQTYPWRDLVFQAWNQGELPFWNPYQLLVMPLLANAQSAALYPPHIVIGVLGIPTGWGITILALLHLWLAGYGAFLLARRLGASEAGAYIGGLAFGLSPFMLAWLPLASVTTTVAWIPWCLLCLLGIYDALGWSKLRFAGGFGLSLAMLLLAGHLQFAAYGLMAILLQLVWLIATRHREWLPAVAAVVAAGLAVLAAWPFLSEVAQYSEATSRRGKVASAEGYAAYNSARVAPYELVGVALPNLLGKSGSFVLVGGDAWPGHWPMYVKRGANFAESAAGIGPLVLLLLFSLRRGMDWRRIGGIALIGGVGLAMALGTPINMLLYFAVPGWSATGSPGRAVVLFLLGACMLAACALPARLEELHWRKPAIATGVLILLCIALVPTLFAKIPAWLPELPDPSVIVSTRFLASMPFVGLAVAFSALALWAMHRQRPAAIVGASFVVTMLIGGPRLVPSGEVPESDLDLPYGVRTAFVNPGWSLFSAVPAIMPPNTPTIARIAVPGGYDSLLPARAVELLREVNGQDPAPPANGNIMLVKPSFDPSALAALGVGTVFSRVALEAFPGVAPNPETGLIVVSLPANVGGMPVPQATSLGYDSMTLSVMAGADGALDTGVLNIEGYSYKVTADSMPSAQVVPDSPTIALTGAEPGSVHEVTLSAPVSISRIAWISLPPLILLGIAAATPVKRRRPQKVA